MFYVGQFEMFAVFSMLPPLRKTASIFVGEEILVQPLEFYGTVQSYAYTEFDHQLSKARAIDQDNPLLQSSHVFNGRCAEGCRSYKHTFACTQSNQATGKPLNFRTAYAGMRSISFGLYIDTVQTETIFIYNSVDTAVAAFA